MRPCFLALISQICSIFLPKLKKMHPAFWERPQRADVPYNAEANMKMSVNGSAHPLIGLSIHLFVSLSFLPSLRLLVHLVNPSIHLCIYPFVRLSVCTSICATVYQSVCLFIHHSVHLPIQPTLQRLASKRKFWALIWILG